MSNNVQDLVQTVILLILCGAATDKIASIIVGGKIFNPFRSFIGKRAFPNVMPKFSLTLRFSRAGWWSLFAGNVKYLTWKVFLFINGMVTCTECLGVWVALGITSFTPEVGLFGVEWLDFILRLFIVAYCASCFEVLRVGRVIAVDVSHTIPPINLLHAGIPESHIVSLEHTGTLKQGEVQNG